MDIEKIARKSLTKLKLKYGLPSSGFIAGGSISNLMWEMVSGNKAIINDIDIFLIDDREERESIFTYTERNLQYFESYGQITSYNKTKDTYHIHETNNDGIYNKIIYSSKNKSPQIIIDSFDINAVMIGYSIDEDKFYWREEFVDFLKSGELKVVSATTPAHTSIRMIKKSYELNCKVDDIEFKILSHILSKKDSFFEIQRFRFLSKYADIYNKHKSFLDKYFTLKRDGEIEEYLLKSKGLDKEVYRLYPICEFDFGPINVTTVSPNNFLFYVRNIFNNTDKRVMDIWKELHFYYKDINYIKPDENYEDIKYLSKISKVYPSIISNLDGMRFREQVEIVKSVMEKVTYHYDYETALAVLQNTKLNNLKLDDDACLILGLSVRKKVNYIQKNIVDISIF